MELTVDQTLQQGVAAHKEGKLQEAERLYRSILQVQPGHGDANHNLGVLAVGVGKVGAALPHFKTALEGNRNQEQYWLSYIDALVKEGQVDQAARVLQQGRESGLKGDKVDQLETQLNTSVDPVSSLQEGIDKLISLYNSNKLREVITEGNVLSSRFPGDHVLPNILGVANKGLGNHEEAITSYTRALDLKREFDKSN